MKFFIDEDLPRSVGNVLAKHHYSFIDIRDTNLRGASDKQIASFIKRKKLCLITGDFDFANIRNYPPATFYGLVVLKIPKDASANYITNLAQEFFKQQILVKSAKGKLFIVEYHRIRSRK